MCIIAINNLNKFTMWCCPSTTENCQHLNFKNEFIYSHSAIQWNLYVQNNKCIVDNWDRNNQPICSHFHVNHSWKIGHTLNTILRERNLYYSKMEWNQVRIVFFFYTWYFDKKIWNSLFFMGLLYFSHNGLVFACSWKINTSQL